MDLRLTESEQVFLERFFSPVHDEFFRKSLLLKKVANITMEGMEKGSYLPSP